MTAYTDGLTAAWHVALHALGWLTIAALVLAVAYSLFLATFIIGVRLPDIRRRVTSWRLHRAHKRSGRA